MMALVIFRFPQWSTARFWGFGLVVFLGSVCLAQPPLRGDSDAPSSLNVSNWPIVFDRQRVQLTLQYIKRHYGLGVDGISIIPRAVVVHWTGTRTATAAHRAFDRVVLRGQRRKLKTAGALNLSAHFLVDRTGTVFRLMPETWVARHCIGLNYDSIGIENVGGGVHGPLNSRQLRANARLIRLLAKRFPIRYLLGHYEVAKYETTEIFREKDPKYRSLKADPGADFMKRLRRMLTDLKLRGPSH